MAGSVLTSDFTLWELPWRNSYWLSTSLFWVCLFVLFSGRGLALALPDVHQYQRKSLSGTWCRGSFLNPDT